MQSSVIVLNFFIFWRDRNVPPIGLTAFSVRWQKLKVFSKTCLALFSVSAIES